MEPHHQVHHRSIIIIIIIIRWRSQSVRPARKCLMGREGSQWDVGNRFLLLPRLLKLATKFDGFLMWVVSFPLKMWNMYVVMNRDVVLGFLLASASTLNPRLGVVAFVLLWMFLNGKFSCALFFIVSSIFFKFSLITQHITDTVIQNIGVVWGSLPGEPDQDSNERIILRNGDSLKRSLHSRLLYAGPLRV